MSTSPLKKIGGEYGEVRASIDGSKLNAYLAKHTQKVVTPVNIKQFKVCPSLLISADCLLNGL
jgi:hypothetical protein